MKIRITILTENDVPLEESVTKEEIERLTKMGWQYVMDSIAANGDANDIATVESCELVSRE